MPRALAAGAARSIWRDRAIMVLGPETAPFTLDCPKCGAQVQLLRAIPGPLREEVRASAQQVGAGGLN